MKRFLSISLALMIAIAMIPAVSQATTQYGYVTGGWLRMRSGPSFNYSTVASYFTGTQVSILGTTGSWYYVQAPDGLKGYMYTAYVSSSGGGTSTAYITSTNGYGVRMRTGPGTGYAVVGVFSVGTAVTVINTGTNWSKVQIGSYVGYVMSKYITSGGGGTTNTATIWSPNGYGVRLRTGPGTGYDIIGVYSVGTLVTILSHGSTWDHVSVGSRTGYIMNYYLKNYSGSGIATGITITPTSASVGQGNSIMLTVNVTGNNLSNPAYTLGITQNASYATLSGNVLTIKNTAPIGAAVIVTATSVDNSSAGVKLTAICGVVISASSSEATSISILPTTANVVRGSSIDLAVDVQGVNLSSPAYTLVTNHTEIASLSGATLAISASATIGTVITVTAYTTDPSSSGSTLAAVSHITVVGDDVIIPPDTNQSVLGVWTGLGSVSTIQRNGIVNFTDQQFSAASNKYTLQGTYTVNGDIVTMTALGYSIDLTISKTNPRTMTGTLEVGGFTATVTLTELVGNQAVTSVSPDKKLFDSTILHQWMDLLN